MRLTEYREHLKCNQLYQNSVLTAAYNHTNILYNINVNSHLQNVYQTAAYHAPCLLTHNKMSSKMHYDQLVTAFA